MGYVTKFLSTPSARRATRRSPSSHRKTAISIHALREEGDLVPLCRAGDHQAISIHALREEGDGCWQAPCWPHQYFYPRPPRGGRRHLSKINVTVGQFLSTPSARRATDTRAAKSRWVSYFYPRPPRGGRLAERSGIDFEVVFLSTPSARRATQEAPELVCNLEISIHALREEGDVEATLDGLTQYDFYPRPPRGGRLRPIFW